MSSTTEEVALLRHRLMTSARISAMLDAPLPKLMPRYYMVRLYVALSVITNCMVAYLEPQSLTAQVLHGSTAGWYCITIMFAMGLVALADVLVNDILPARFSLPTVRENRHTGYISIAVATMGLTYAVMHHRGYTPLMLTYWVDAGFAASVAFLDLFARHRGIA